MDDDNSGEVFQYYTIINESSNDTEEKEDNTSQIVYFTIDDECVEDPPINMLEPCEDSTKDESLPTFDSNVQIITLGDGTMFMTTTSEDENFETIEPHLLSNDTVKQEVDVKQDEGSSEIPNNQESSLDDNYEIVHVLDNSPQLFEMVHMPKQTNFKPYACTEEGCDKTFSTNYSLKAHIRTHTGEKPYSCSICEKAFKTSGDLQKHVRIHTGEKPFMCPIQFCGKSFTTSNIRKVHVRSHTGERPYTCNYPNCGKAFSSSTNYKNHIRIHSGEKPYICQVENCGKRFTEYSSLYKHNMVHKSNRPYTCRFCGQKFKQQSAMSLHKRVKHNVIIATDGTEIVVDIN